MLRAGARRLLQRAAAGARSRGATAAVAAQQRASHLPPLASPNAPAWAPLLLAGGRHAPGAARFASDAAAAAAASPPEGEERFAFQSETKRVLEIVTHSLYTERDIFLRELVSNACDALEKARLNALSTGADIGTLDVRITTGAGTLTVEDSGCGMTKEELVANLGTIARSGTAEWAAKAAASGDKAGAQALIGRFGVGFYAAFMVADRAEVFTRAAGGAPLAWRSDGGGVFTIGPASEAEAPARGTRVVLHLKPDAAGAPEFTTAQGVEAILKKHSAFVPHPVFVDGARVNTLPALWALRPAEVSDEQHAEYFASLCGGGSATPAFRMHFSADAPLSLSALLYFPRRNEELTLGAGMERMEPGVSLYCRKVLIQRNSAGLLPPYLRFLKGAVDCEDVPLNISRETLQDAAVVRRLRDVLTTRALKFLADAANKDAKAYEDWFAAMGTFVKEGICSDVDDKRKEALAKLLRFETTAQPRGELTSLEAALGRSKERVGAAEAAPPARVYYLVAQSREAAESSPYLEAFRARGIEVLLLYTPADEIVMKMLGAFQGAALVSAEEADLSAEAAPPAPDAAAGEPLSDADMATLCAWLHDGALSGQVAAVRPSTRLTDSPAVLVGHMPEALRKLQAVAAGRLMDPAAAAALLGGVNTATLELNPRHPLVKRLAAAAGSADEAKKSMATLVAAQVLDSARIAAGAIDDPRAMLSRLSDICAAALADK